MQGTLVAICVVCAIISARMMNSARRRWVRRLSLGLLVVFIMLAILIMLKGIRVIAYGINYAELIVEAVKNDHKRIEDNKELMAQIQWDYFKVQAKFMKEICLDKGTTRHDVTWLSVLVNDEYVIPAVVLGHSIQSLSCVKSMIVFVSNKVSKLGRLALKRTGWKVQEVEAMDCRWMERKLGQTPSADDSIIGTHTRFHAWNYTQYRKIIYADPDVMLISNIDELFDIPDDFAAVYCGRQGMVDPCFNAGLLVFKPNQQDHKSIMDMWHLISSSDACPNDQRLLWHHYADNGRWKPLPFAYNVRRIIHQPMKAYHFVRYPLPKPWRIDCRPSRNEAHKYDAPIRNLYDMSIVFWKMLYAALKKYEIENWWQSTKFYKYELEYGSKPFVVCLNEKELNILD